MKTNKTPEAARPISGSDAPSKVIQMLPIWVFALLTPALSLAVQPTAADLNNVKLAITMSVNSAAIKYHGKMETATIAIWADVVMTTPAADDVISILADGVVVMKAPFSAFVMDRKGACQYACRNVTATIDLDAGTLFAMVRKCDTKGLNAENGIDVQLRVGEQSADRHIWMIPMPAWYLVTTNVRPQRLRRCVWTIARPGWYLVHEGGP